MKTSTIAVTMTVIGDGLTGDVYTPPTSPAVNTNCPMAAPGPSITLAPGANNVPVPAGARTLVLVPPAGSTNAKWLGTTSGGGFPFDPAVFGILPIPANTSTVPIYSTGAETCAAAWG